jgi:hypothetical protein
MYKTPTSYHHRGFIASTHGPAISIPVHSAGLNVPQEPTATIDVITDTQDNLQIPVASRLWMSVSNPLSINLPNKYPVLEKAKIQHSWTRGRVYSPNEYWMTAYDDFTRPEFDTDHAREFRDGVSLIVFTLHKHMLDPKNKYTVTAKEQAVSYCENTKAMLDLNPRSQTQIKLLINFIKASVTPDLLDGDLDFWGRIQKDMQIFAYNMDRFDRMMHDGSLRKRHVNNYINGIKRMKKRILAIDIPTLYMTSFKSLNEVIRLELVILESLKDGRSLPEETIKALNEKMAAAWEEACSDWILMRILAGATKSLHEEKIPA